VDLLLYYKEQNNPANDLRNRKKNETSFYVQVALLQ